MCVTSSTENTSDEGQLERERRSCHHLPSIMIALAANCIGYLIHSSACNQRSMNHDACREDIVEISSSWPFFFPFHLLCCNCYCLSLSLSSAFSGSTAKKGHMGRLSIVILLPLMFHFRSSVVLVFLRVEAAYSSILVISLVSFLTVLQCYREKA